jgi:hypothetical protein
MAALFVFGCLVFFALMFFTKSGSGVEDNIKLDNTQEILDLRNKLSELLNKSRYLVKNVIPSLLNKIQNCLNDSEKDFTENAYYPFWNNIENATKDFLSLAELISMLEENGKVYTNIINNFRDNIPKSYPNIFPYGKETKSPQDLLKNYNSLIRKAHTNVNFANIYGHFRTQKILLKGFSTLAEAIENMTHEMNSAFDSLNNSINQNFGVLQDISLSQLKEIKGCRKILDEKLEKIDSSLNYIKYKEIPLNPFERPIN